jgi:7-cyano-7-deazaguanine synthase
MGNWDSELVGYYTPYLHTDKFGILQDGQELCDYLELEFDEVYKRTNTSYKPLQFAEIVSQEEVIGNDNTKLGTKTIYSLVWYSDYKSASSVERIEAFLKLGRPDPVAYADETGPVSWEVAKAHVENVLASHAG